MRTVTSQQTLAEAAPDRDQLAAFPEVVRIQASRCADLREDLSGIEAQGYLAGLAIVAYDEDGREVRLELSTAAARILGPALTAAARHPSTATYTRRRRSCERREWFGR